MGLQREEPDGTTKHTTEAQENKNKTKKNLAQSHTGKKVPETVFNFKQYGPRT